MLVGQRIEQLRGAGLRNCGDVADLVDRLGLAEDVIITGYIPDGQVGTYYRHAELLVFPSLFEGFGLPPVEAIGFGLPVLTTRCTAIPEITGNAAVYLDDPLDQEEIADKTEMILRRPDDFRPGAGQREAFRGRYDAVRIAAMYHALLTGDGGVAAAPSPMTPDSRMRVPCA